MKYKREIKKISKYCAYCGCKFKDYKDKNINLFVPASMGGKPKLNNLVCCCTECLRNKNMVSISEWINSKGVKYNILLYLFRMKSFKSGYFENIYKSIKKYTNNDNNINEIKCQYYLLVI